MPEPDALRLNPKAQFIPGNSKRVGFNLFIQNQIIIAAPPLALNRWYKRRLSKYGPFGLGCRVAGFDGSARLVS
jgi:hypothetical protein